MCDDPCSTPSYTYQSPCDQTKDEQANAWCKSGWVQDPCYPDNWILKDNEESQKEWCSEGMCADPCNETSPWKVSCKEVDMIK
mmetsp:Transcript_36121/g.44055  ORF Transcript_36121/g.44055 Transcript_36121/m.44055 type:complete len:83 (-) Transcript_36121:130-378(-)